MANPTKPETKKREKKDPRKAWQEIAPRRIGRVLQTVNALSKLARPTAYTWTPTELTEMIAALGDAFERCERCFRNPGTVKVEGFKFSGR